MIPFTNSRQNSSSNVLDELKFLGFSLFVWFFFGDPSEQGVAVVASRRDNAWASFSASAKLRQGRSLEVFLRWKKRVLNRFLMWLFDASQVWLQPHSKDGHCS